jgi:hypothetical protein
MKATRYIGAAALLMLAGSACTKNFEQLNTPRTSSVLMDPGLVLTKAQKDANFQQGGEGVNIQFGSWAQHWASGNVGVAKTSRYIQQPDDGTWSSHYAIIRNLAQIRNKLLAGKEATPEGRSRLAIARIMEVAVWERLTALYGDIPYSESGLSEDKVNPTPKYDDQKEIYKDLITQLNKAISQITNGDQTYGNADMYYKGDLNLWRKYGNALKLQIGMRIRKADPALAQQVVTEAMAAPLIASNNETAAVQMVTTLPANYHPVMAQYASGSPDLQYVAKALVDRLVATKDPRLTLIASPTANSQKTVPQVLVYRGIDVALTDADLAAVVRADYSLASTRTWFNRTIATPIPVYVMTYADVCFLRAEAALEGWGATTAQAATFYQEGVKAAMAMNPYFITTIPADFTEQTLPSGTKDEQLNKIMTQRWISMFSRSYDAYLEWRRTGYPALTPGKNIGSTNGTIPRRTAYPSDEPILNGANYNAAKAKLTNGDAYTSRIWIDK